MRRKIRRSLGISMKHLKLFEAFDRESTGKSWYYGIADCKGIESFLKEPDLGAADDMDALVAMGLSDVSGKDDPAKKRYAQELGMMSLRCQFNTQRHPVVYRVELTDSSAQEIEDLIDSGEYEEALILLKERALTVQLARGRGVNAEKAWNNNPDRDVDPMSENLKYHVNENISIAESVFRPGSDSHLSLLSEARQLFDAGQIELSGIDKELFEETDLGRFGEYNGEIVPLDFLYEAEYHGKSVELGKPMRGGKKKYHVYVMNPKTKKVKLISFGDVHGGLTAKVSDPKARKSFAARHQCHLKTDKLSAGYWACRINRYAHLWGGKTYPGFW